MAVLPKISRAKGVEICADLLYAGQSRKEILQHIAENYKASVKTVDNWLKEARPIVAERLAVAEVVRAKVDKEEVEASAKRLNLTRERVLEEYAKIAFFDIRKILTVDGGLKPVSDMEDEEVGAVAGIESYDEKSREGEVLGTVRKIKIWDKRAALDSICKVMGYNAPDKADITTHNSNPIDYSKYTDAELRTIADLQRKGRVGAEESA